MNTETRSEILAYCAGLLDGEGSFCFRKAATSRTLKATNRKNPVYSGLIRIGMTQRVGLEFLNTAFPGGSLLREGVRKDRPSYQVMYRWELRKVHLIKEALKELIPYLRVKKEQAQLLLETLENWKTPANKNLGIDPEELQRRDLAYSKMRQLNATGAAARFHQQSEEEQMEKKASLGKEIWKAIPFFEGVYAVSDEGRVKKIEEGRIQEKFIKPHYHRGREAVIHLIKGGESRAINLKKLVMSLFSKENLDLPIIHKNKDVNDFKVSNLCYVTELVIEECTEKSLPGEKWKTCPSYPELMVSSLGRIYAKSTYFKGTNNLGEEGWNLKKGKIRKLDKRRSSLVHVKNKRIGINKQMRVNALVLEAFVGPSNVSIVHKNGIKHDDRLENLEYDYNASC